ncbi:hypothetical protein OCJ37_19430 [Xanthomonas sp. AM6]|uniref:hypothetical protein n=1 Tax=Xanthomonas sp. AM6 TaxID=2982531 RepID=UPI0021D8956F|nr:hypothetical protein [Xanthomonas sp. AM6]UYB52111.1 hypothetical protein OCJ37_19430 [Xanthomonas sp. AM6]
MRYSSQKILSRDEADAINTLNGRVSFFICGAVGVMTARVGLWGGFAVGLVCGEALSQAKDPVHAGDVLHTKVDICPDATGNNDKTSGWVEYRK